MTSSGRFFAAWAIVLGLGAVLVLVPGLGGGFIFDDFDNIVRNTSLHLRSLSLDGLLYAAYSFEPGGSSRPLAMLSFALDFWRAGLDPVAFKTTNLLIHAVSCAVLAVLLRRVLLLGGWNEGRAGQAALLMALFWAVHPLQVSSVLYVVQRMQTLGTLFILLALLAYVRMRQAQMHAAPFRTDALLTLLWAVLAFASKEDAVLLPAYTLALELTVLKFAVADPAWSRRLRAGYAAAVLLGLLVFVFVALPRYWHWDWYPRREFSSLERLLTQGRVLVLYLWQMLVPWPDSLRFFYDDVEVSRGVLTPWTTLPAWMCLTGLLVLAWKRRSGMPVFSLGVLLFFFGHALTSNIIPLELAFEHRNHFPLAGVVLAAGDVLRVTFRKLRLPVIMRGIMVIALLGVFGSASAVRAHVWGDPLRMARHTLELAPRSERAWAFLCSTYFERSRQRVGSPELDLAIETCERGAEALPESAILQNNVLVFKTVRGDATQADWDRVIERLAKVRMSVQNKRILWTTLNNVDRGLYDNEESILRIIDIVSSRSTLRPAEHIRVAAYIFNNTQEPVKAFPHMKKAVEASRPDDPDILKMFRELRAAGRGDWVERLEQIHGVSGN